MNRLILSRSVKLGSVFTLFNSQDNPAGETPTEKSTTIITHETGKDRLIRMFQTDEFNTITPEASSILQVGSMSIFIGALYGGILSSRTAYMDFMKNNQATVFKDHIDAKKKLQDKVTLSFGKGAFKWAWRLSLFSTTYMGISTMISVYRGKYGIMEHIIAGTSAGFLYKFPQGPRGWIVGAGLGLVLGTIAGSCSYGLLKLTGMTMDEVRYWQYDWQDKRVKNFNEAVKDQLEKDELFIKHDETVGKNKGLENITLPEKKT